MAKKKSVYKVEFSIDNLTMREQQEVFNNLIKSLNYDQRQDLHITVTDSIGGKHFVWDGYGIDPNGTRCEKCKMIECDGCPIYEKRMEFLNGKNDSNAGND